MDARLATRLLWTAVALWLVACPPTIALAASGEHLSPAVNMVLFAGLSTVTVCLLIIRSHNVQSARLEQLQADLTTMSERLDHRDAALYRDFIRRLDQTVVRLDHMKDWMMRPAIPRGPIRASAAAATLAAAPLDEPTQPMPTVDVRGEVREMQAEVIDLGGRIARRIVDDAT